MNNKQVFLANLVNKFNNQKDSNDSKKIQEKASGHNITISRPNTLNANPSQSSNINGTNSGNSQALNQAASAGLSAAGVPKPIADKTVNSDLGQKAMKALKNKSFALRAFDKLMGGSKNEEQEEQQEGTFENLKVSIKVIKTVLMVMPFAMQLIVFCCLFIGASQIFINSVNLGMADSLSNQDTEKKINENKDKWNNEITDEHENIKNEEDVWQPKYLDTYLISGVSSVKYVQIARTYNEADLSELNDFYGTSIYSSDDTSDNVDMNVVYDFYFKLYDIYTYYKTNYNGVELDLPLLMATLNVQSKDRAIVFESNTINYVRSENNERFAYDKVHVYTSTPTKSEYDIEVLAQNMISLQAKETCVDSAGKEISSNILRDEQIGTQVLTCAENQTYNVTEAKYDIDEQKYKEFLPGFLEKKYFLDENVQNFNENDDILDYNNNYSDGNATMSPGVALESEPDPSIAVNYWKNVINPSDFVYPKDELTGLSLGAWPKNHSSISTQLKNMTQYQGSYIWPTTPTSGVYTFVYEHNGMDIMAKFGTPVYSPVDGTLIYSTWGHTSNKGSDETAYSVSIEPDIKVEYAGTVIDRIFFTHLSGIRYRCEYDCNRKVKQGELVGFVGNAAGNSTSVGWAPHLHLTYYNTSSYDATGLTTSNLEKFYNITTNTKRNVGE